MEKKSFTSTEEVATREKKGSTLPELLAGLSLLLTSALICLKNPDSIVELRNAFQLPSLGAHAGHTRTAI